MSKPYFISDLHLGHKSLLSWSGKWRGGHDVESHIEWLIESINNTCEKRDLLWILGDIAWNNQWLHHLSRLNPSLKFILGNHDKMLVTEYLKYGKVYPGLVSYKTYWLSHAPIHPAELRDRRNIHGHVHHKSIKDDRYINVCVEALRGEPLCLFDIV